MTSASYAKGAPHALDVREIEQMLRGRAEELAWELLPNARRDGHFLCVGSISGEAGNSLKFNISGANRGMWTDFSAPGAGGTKYQGGDCLHLIRLVLFAGEMVAAIKWARSWLGIDHLDPGRLATARLDARAAAEKSAVEDKQLRETKRRRAVSLWMGSKPIAGTPAEAYLRGRGIDLSVLGKWPGSLRFHAEVWNREQSLKIPAMVSAMFTPDGAHVATHRTYLQYCQRRGWTKLDSPNAKMVLGACGGSFIPLRKGVSGKSMSDMPEGEAVHITEGIEDALTVAMAKPDCRIVAGYSLPNIGGIVFPPSTGSLVLLCDRDASGSTAVDALERVIAKQQARGVQVRFVMPPAGVKDFNEWLQTGAQRADQSRGERAA